MALKHGENEDDFIDTIEDELAVEVPEEEDPSEQEQEEMVEYMEKFEHLLSLGDYEEAAIVAATSPQDILRTAATFQRFKEQRPCPGEKSPLLFYCEAVVDNSVGPGQKGLSASESCEAVERAFDEGRRDLVVQWICQKKLKDSDGTAVQGNEGAQEGRVVSVSAGEVTHGRASREERGEVSQVGVCRSASRIPELRTRNGVTASGRRLPVVSAVQGRVHCVPCNGE